jgi:hypothetical protein
VKGYNLITAFIIILPSFVCFSFCLLALFRFRIIIFKFTYAVFNKLPKSERGIRMPSQLISFLIDLVFSFANFKSSFLATLIDACLMPDIWVNNREEGGREREERRGREGGEEGEGKQRTESGGRGITVQGCDIQNSIRGFVVFPGIFGTKE